MNFHSPERQPNESYAQYKVRRKLAARLVQVARTGQITEFQQKLLDRFKKGEIK